MASDDDGGGGLETILWGAVLGVALWLTAVGIVGLLVEANR